MPLQYGHLHAILGTTDRINVLVTPFIKKVGEGDQEMSLIDFEALGKNEKASLVFNRLIGNLFNVTEEIKRTDIGTMIDFDLEAGDDDIEAPPQQAQPDTGSPPEGDATNVEDAAEAVAAATGDEIDNLLEDGPP